MDYGIALAPGADAWKTVHRAEALGFSHAWFYDTQLLCADSISPPSPRRPAPWRRASARAG